MFYRWQKQFFEQGASAFRPQTDRKERAYQRRIAQLQAKLERKNEVVSELLEEHVQLKKELGDL